MKLNSKLLLFSWKNTSVSGPPQDARWPRLGSWLDFEKKKTTAAARQWSGCHYGVLGCQKSTVASPEYIVDWFYIWLLQRISVQHNKQSKDNSASLFQEGDVTLRWLHSNWLYNLMNCLQMWINKYLRK